MTQPVDLDAIVVKARTIACDAMKAVLAEFDSLSDEDLLRVQQRFGRDLEAVGYPMAEPNFLHEAALYEARCRIRQREAETESSSDDVERVRQGGAA